MKLDDAVKFWHEFSLKNRKLIGNSKTAVRIFDKVKVNNGCWLWQGSTLCGYGRIWFNKRMEGAHRIVVHAFQSRSLNEIAVVMHTCDVRNCINPTHLKIGTLAENNSDRSRKGRSRDQKGEKNSQAKITESQAISIKKLLKAGKKCSVIARRFNVSLMIVWNIQQGKNWKHLK